MTSGFEELQAWLPEVVFDVLNPHATVTTEVARHLISTALSTTIIALSVLLATSLIGGLRDVVLSRGLHRKTGRLLAFIRKVAFGAVTAAPWWAVWQMADGRVPGAGVEAVVVLGVLAWVFAVTVDHSGVWLDQGEATIHMRRGFAIFRVRRVAIHLERALIDREGGAPIGPVASEQGAERGVRSVSVLPEAWGLLCGQLGQAGAIDFMESALSRYGLGLDVETLPAAA